MSLDFTGLQVSVFKYSYTKFNASHGDLRPVRFTSNEVSPINIDVSV